VHRRQFLTTSLFTLACPSLLGAAQRPYRLGANGATIRYTFRLNGLPVTGTMPVNRADLTIDPGNLANSTAEVTADARRARTGPVFATEALKSPGVLNADTFPLVRFRSTRVILAPDDHISGGAVLEGQLTLRGVSQPIRFDANLYRHSGSTPSDLSRLTATLRGQLNRRDYGIVNYPDLVADTVAVSVDAEITAA